ncbi:hypothetical protein [Saccharopolyspora mangrovi]|uniref:ATP-binding protein n=1 Tax=Saccharopolyspora mangrovi TaxID=3082379 RepID=A0ABU6AD61_9PSEU|nr:hypothetical protein [Saccharopolyspora sp. S2-29]MEB3369407.1 hypothetical protein [Saccharopolyspora sp. S2-29]
MKRTFTAAAAVLVGGAGAVGFATTATAAETPQLPASLPTDNGVANTVFHAAGTVASAQKTVGDVVPLEKHLTGRSGDPVSQVVSGTPAAGLVKPVVDAVQDASTGHTHSLDPASAIDEAPLPSGSTLPAGKSGLPGLDALGPVSDVVGGLPVGSTLPTGKSGLPGLDALGPVSDVAGGLPVGSALPTGKTGLPGLPGLDALGPVTDIAGGLPLADSLPVGKSGATDALPTTLTGTLDQVTQSAPQTKPGQLPTNIVGDTASNVLENNTELGGAPLPTGKSGDPVSDVAGGLPVVSDAQNLTGKTGSPLDKVNDVVSHGPLGSATQLGN